MADQRSTPYSGFNFQVDWGQSPGPDTLIGGFSDVSGLNTELVIAEYRVGNEVGNHVRKHGGLHKTGDCTLKRGVINSMDFFQWIKNSRTDPTHNQREVTITLFDEAQKPVQKWILHNALPMKYTGPTLAAAKGDTAVEELVLSSEDFEISDKV